MRYSKTLLTFEGQEGSHPSEDDLEEYVFGRLEGDALDEVEEHLLLCEDCRRRLTETENFVASTRAAARKMVGAPPPTPKARRFSAPAWALAFAMGALLLTVAYNFVPFNRVPQSIELTAERSASRARVQAGQPVDLQLDVRGLDPRWLEIVDAQGSRIQVTAIKPVNGTVTHRAPPLPAGQVWIRLYAQPSPRAEVLPLREFSLLAE